MKQGNDFMTGMLDLDTSESANDVLWRACRPVDAQQIGGDVVFTVPFQAQKQGLLVDVDPDVPRRTHVLRVRAYGESVVRLSVSFAGDLPDDESPMLELYASLSRELLTVETTEDGWTVRDSAGVVRLRVRTAAPSIQWWSDLITGPEETLDLTLYPDGETAVPLMAYDQFFPRKHESMALAYVARAGVLHRTVCSFYVPPAGCRKMTWSKLM